MIQTQRGFNKIQKGDYVKAALSDDASAFNANVDKTEALFDTVEQTKANVSTVHNVTLLNGEWTGEQVPYYYRIEIEGITQNSIQEIALASTANFEQIEGWNLAGLVDAGQETGAMKIASYGTKPRMDLPVVLVVRGDVF